VLRLLIAAAIGYLLGSIPTSILAGRRLRGIDIREHGSGNAGASNMLRLLGWKPALVVLAIDVGKGCLAAWLGGQLAPSASPGQAEWLAMLAGLAAIAGHLWPLFARFRGGKGVATAAGVLLALQPQACGVCVLVFALVVWLTRRISVGSMAAALAYPIVLLLYRDLLDRPVSTPGIGFAVIIAVVIVTAHHSNLRALLRGEEPAIGSNPQR